jgi:predicted dehydrogenase
MTKNLTSKKILALVLALAMAFSVMAVSAYAAGNIGGTPAQDHYFWWFNPSTHDFEPAPMGDDAVKGYVYDGTDLVITFGEMEYHGVTGWFSYIDADNGVWEIDGTKGTLTVADAVGPTLIHITEADIELATGTHIPLSNLYFEVDY